MMQELLNEIPWPKPSKFVVNLEHIFSDDSQNDERNLLPSLTNHFECLTALPNMLLCKQQNDTASFPTRFSPPDLCRLCTPKGLPAPCQGQGGQLSTSGKRPEPLPPQHVGLGLALCSDNSFHGSHRHLVSLSSPY